MGDLLGYFFVVVILFVVAAFFEIRNKIIGRAWTAAARELRFHRRWHRVTTAFRIQGKINGHKVVVDTMRLGRGENAEINTRFRVWYPRSLRLGLKLTREAFLYGQRRRDIQVGDPEFDEAVHVKGREPELIVRFLTQARRVRIHRAMLSHPSMRIDDRMVLVIQPGLAQSTSRIVTTVRRLAQLAFYLSARRDEDAQIEKAMDAKRRGRIRKAIETARQVPTTHGVVPVEARIIEAESLYLADRKEEAAKVFTEVREVAPDDPEILAWTEELAPAGEPVDEVAEAAPADQPVEEPAAAPEVDLDVATVCEDLFPPAGGSLDANRRFEEKYEGREVRWSGELKSVTGFTYDYVFGSEPGTKAVLEIHQTHADIYGTRTIQAVLQLPPEAQSELQDDLGKRFTFVGTLKKADGFVRNIFVGDARIVS